jgi:cell division protein FtsZ
MGEHELTMDELGEITDYVYDVASSDALIIRGLSKDENLGDKICVTVIATGFEPNSVLEPYRTNTKTEKINLETGQVSTAVPEKKKEEQDTIRVKTKKRELFDDFENDLQKKLEFDFVARDDEEQDGLTQGDGTLRKIKHMQNILKNEGLSNQTMRENVDEFEDVPAFIRKKIKIDNDKRKDNSEVSKFTLSDDDDEPSLRDDNAYLNDNVD